MPDRLTLEEAKAEIQEMKRQNSGHCMVSLILKNALSILSRVQLPEPDEEGQAVLWLIRRMGWRIYYAAGWRKADECYTFNPTEEAKKMGWGGGE